ncbi:MAG: hypothetical protein ACTSSP_08535 [Candidatus Asgardarchaeia archaeon]
MIEEKTLTTNGIRDLLEAKLNDYLDELEENKITRTLFCEKNAKIRKNAELYGVPCSGGQGVRHSRNDYRDDAEFQLKQRRTGREELRLMTEFKDLLERKGNKVEIQTFDDKPLGWAYLKAPNHPDFKVMLNNYNTTIEIKNFVSNDVALFKVNNLQCYKKHNSSIFLTTTDKCLFLNSACVKRLSLFSGGVKYSDNGMPFYDKKILVEVSKRESREITLEELQEDGLVEIWDRGESMPIWEGPLKQFNREQK